MPLDCCQQGAKRDGIHGEAACHIGIERRVGVLRRTVVGCEVIDFVGRRIRDDRCKSGMVGSVCGAMLHILKMNVPSRYRDHAVPLGKQLSGQTNAVLPRPADHEAPHQ